MGNKNPRLYSGRDVEMLTKASVILQVASEHQDELMNFDTTYATEYFEDFTTRIENAMANIIGTDHSIALRQSTAVVKTIQKSALENLSIVHTQINARFASNKARQNEILTTLGFNQYYKKAKSGDQEALIQLLYRFQTYAPSTPSLVGSTSPNLRTELEAKGIPSPRLTQLTNFANQMREANNTQEDEKGDRKELTQEVVTELNNIYAEVITLCKIAQKVFKDNNALKERFVYHKAKATTTTEDEETTMHIAEVESSTEETPETPETPETESETDPS